MAGRGAPDARQDILRREMERRMQLRDRERQVRDGWTNSVVGFWLERG